MKWVMNDLYDSYVIKGFNKKYIRRIQFNYKFSDSKCSKIDSSLYEIIQDPWQDSLPNLRKFGI